MTSTINSSVDELSTEDDNFRMIFEKDEHYKFLGEMVKIINDRKTNSFNDLILNIEKMIHEINTT